MAGDVRPLRRRGRDDDAGASAPDPTLEALLSRVARGDEAAFEQIYDDVSSAVFGLVRRVLRDPAQAEVHIDREP